MKGSFLEKPYLKKKKAFPRKRQIEDGLKKVHSAEPSGSWCGDQRQPGGGSGSAVIEEKILQRVTAGAEVIGHSVK